MSETAQDPVGLLQQYRALRMRQSQLRIVSAVVLVAIFLIFGWRFYSLVNNFDGDKFADALTENGQRAWPSIEQGLDSMATKLVPLYLDEVVRQADKQMPVLEKIAEKEVEALGANLVATIEMRTEKTRADAADAIDQALTRHHPDLAKEPAKREVIKQAILSEFEATTTAMVQKRIAEPAADFKAMIAATAKLSEQAQKEKKPGIKPEAKVVVSLMTVMSRHLLKERDTILKAAQDDPIVKAGKDKVKK